MAKRKKRGWSLSWSCVSGNLKDIFQKKQKNWQKTQLPETLEKILPRGEGVQTTQRTNTHAIRCRISSRLYAGRMEGDLCRAWLRKEKTEEKHLVIDTLDQPRFSREEYLLEFFLTGRIVGEECVHLAKLSKEKNHGVTGQCKSHNTNKTQSEKNHCGQSGNFEPSPPQESAGLLSVLGQRQIFLLVLSHVGFY